MLWHAPGAALPGELLTSLSRRIAHITVCTDSFAAMAEVCALEARRQSQQSVAPQGTVLLIVQPAMLSDAAEVVTELRTYAPGALAWKYDAGANPRLSAVVESDVARWATRTTRATGGGAAAAAGVDSSARTHDSNLSSSVTVTATHGGSSLTPASTPRPTPSGPSGAPQPPARHATSSPSPAPETPAHGGISASNDGPRRLRLTDAPPPVREANPRGPEVTVRPGASRGLRLRGQGEGASSTPSPPSPPPRPTLTPEEMHMLLGEDLHDHDGPDHGHNGHGDMGGSSR